MTGRDFITLDQLRAQPTTTTTEQRERESRIRLHDLLIQLPNVHGIRFTRDPYCAFDLLILSGTASGATVYAVELKERSANYTSTHLHSWWIEAAKRDRVNALIQPHPTWKAMHVSAFPHEQKALAWPLEAFAALIHKQDAPRSQERRKERREKDFVSYRTSAAQILQASA